MYKSALSQVQCGSVDSLPVILQIDLLGGGLILPPTSDREKPPINLL
jgi:hypothetical protein